jgi:uncharacterized protein (TIGR03435 family)
MRVVNFAAGLVCIFCAGRLASAADPQFEVASVRPTTAREIGGLYTYPGGRIELRGCTLAYMIEEAFNLQPFQVSGGPGWMQSDRFDIDAKPPASSRSIQSMPSNRKARMNDEQRQMLQSLLIERFQLKYRRDSREGSVYLLERGSKPLKLADSKDKNEFPWAGSIAGGALSSDGLAGINESMDDLARRLSRYLERPVLNRTEIAGSFDFKVSYESPDARPDRIAMIFTTVQELGLKLETSRGPIESVVIEHVEKPSEN